MKCRWIVLALAIALSGSLPACFDLREPPAPAGGSDFTPANTPDILLSNLTAALGTYNVVNYERCLSGADRFRFLADPTIAANNQGLFGNWNLQTQELEYVRNLTRLEQPGRRGNLVLANPRINNLGADSVEYIATYTLDAYHQDTAYVYTRFVGQMILGMVRNESNEWRISQWRDTKTDPLTPSWTDLRQRFAAR